MPVLRLHARPFGCFFRVRLTQVNCRKSRCKGTVSSIGEDHEPRQFRASRSVVPRHTVLEARKLIEQQTKIPGSHVMISATHTHTGPVLAREAARDDSDGGSGDLAWVALGGEVFVELGLSIKAASPFKQTHVIELANGSFGYIPNRSAYAEGNYEVVSARCAEGSGEILVTAAIRMLAELTPAPDEADPPKEIIEPPH